MDDICFYTVQLRGLVSDGELNALGPLQVKAVQAGLQCTLLTFSADQSGLVGLISYLHGQGYIILGLKRVENP